MNERICVMIINLLIYVKKRNLIKILKRFFDFFFQFSRITTRKKKHLKNAIFILFLFLLFVFVIIIIIISIKRREKFIM